MKKPIAVNNVYTAILAIALGIVIATAGFVATKCYLDYETVLKIAEVIR